MPRRVVGLKQVLLIFLAVVILTSSLRKITLRSVWPWITQYVGSAPYIKYEPKVALTVVLPSLYDPDTPDKPPSSAAYRYLLREDVYNLAPYGYNKEPVFLVNYSDMTSQLDLEEIKLYRDVYPLGDASIPLMIKVIILVKALSLKRDKVLMLSGCNVVDWGVFNDSLVNVGADEVVCLAEGDEENCNSYNILYPMTVIDNIFNIYISEGSKSYDLDEIDGWINWIHEKEFTVRTVKSILSDPITNIKELMKHLMIRDPRYDDLKQIDTSAVSLNVNNILSRLRPAVAYVPDPTWIELPPTCVGGGAIFMVQSVHKYSVRRNLYRRLFKAAGVESYYFIMGRPVDSISYEMLMEESVEHQDIVLYDEVDAYMMLTYKSYAAMVFVKNYCPKAKVMYKMDHDILVNFASLPYGSNIPQVNCLHAYYKHWHSEIKRADFPYNPWTLAYKVWPFDRHLGYCSGGVYGLRVDALKEILKYIQQFSWLGERYSLSSSAYSLEDVMITGWYRTMAGIADIRKVGSAEHMTGKTVRRINEEEFKERMERQIEELKELKLLQEEL